MNDPALCHYNKIDASIIDQLRHIVGERYVLHGSPEELEPYSHDEIAEKSYAHMPECIVKPGTAEEIARIMKLACANNIAVTPRGAGSGLSGGAVPLCGGIVILFDRMDRIVDYDRANMTITCEPGVITNEINKAIKEDGLFYAGYPMSYEACTIGGNVAENAGGARAIKYGVTSRYVIGLECVTPQGDIIRLGGKLAKDVSGYNLLQLLVGSEGTLGIFTRITLKLLPLPAVQIDMIAPFDSVESAIATVPHIMTSTGIIPSSMEFMDRLSMETACRYLGETVPGLGAEAVLLISVDGNNNDQVMRECEIIGEQCMDRGASDIFIADNPRKSEALWKVRRNISEAIKAASPRQSSEDIVVPIAQIPAMVAGLKSLADDYDLMIPCYGHAADGNLHATVVMNPEWSSQEWHDRLKELLTEIYRLTIDLGGAISGEHGIGHKRKEYLAMFCHPAHLEMMRAIKRALDPCNILNPGKIFDL
jgi:glycolate oxidase